MSSRGIVTKPLAIAWMAAFLFSLVLGLGHRAAAAHVDIRGSIEAAVHFQRSAEMDPSVTGVVAGRMDMRTSFDRWLASLTLEPRAQAGLAGESGSPAGSIGAIEGFVGYQADIGDFFVGRVSLPIETARLTLPYTLTPPDETGRRRGMEGARADLYLGASRLQVAAVREGDRWTPLAALRHAFSGWEATGHLLLHERGPAAGVGWSGLAGSTVVYGEAWSVPDEPRLRYSIGASGYLGDTFWTGELARAPFVPGTTFAVPLVAFQLSHAPAPGLILVADTSVALDGIVEQQSSPAGEERAHHWGIAATYELAPGESEVEISFRHSVLPGVPATLSAGLGLRYFF